MPRLRRKRVDALDWSERTRTYLLTGSDFEFLEGEDLQEEDLRAAWEDLREELIEEWMQDHPGCRPWAWWVWDRGIERPLQLVGKPAETAYLAAHGLLSEKERKAFMNQFGRFARLRDDGGFDV